VKFFSKYTIIWICSWLVLGGIGYFTNSAFNFQYKSGITQSRLDNLQSRVKHELNLGLEHTDRIFQDEKIILFAYEQDSMVFWNNLNFETDLVEGMSTSGFVDWNDQVYYFDRIKTTGQITWTGIPLSGTSRIKTTTQTRAITLFSPDRKQSTLLFIGQSLPVWIEWLAVFFCLLGLSFGIADILKRCLQLLAQQQMVRSLLLFTLGIFLLRITSLVLLHLADISHIPLFDQSVTPSLLSPTLADMIINIILLCLLIWFIRAHIRPAYFRKEKSKLSFVIALANYWMVYVTAFLMVHIFKQLVMGSGLSFDFEYIFYLDIKSLIALAGILILAIALFVLDLHLLRIIRHLGMSPASRLVANTLALLGIIPLLYILPTELPVLLLLALAGYLSLLDLFVDQIRPHAAWYLTWMVTGSILVSSLLYQFHIDKELDQRITLARQLKEKIQQLNPGKSLIEPALQNQLYRLESNSAYLALYTIRYQPYRLPTLMTPVGDGISKFDDSKAGTPTLFVALDPESGFYLTKKSNQLFKAFSFFSYIFVLFNVLLIAFTLINNRMRWIAFPIFKFFPSRYTLRYRIQVSMLGMSFCSFILIGCVIVFYLKKTSEGLQTPLSSISLQSLQYEIGKAVSSNLTYNPHFKIYSAGGQLINSPVAERMPFNEFHQIHVLDRLPYHTNVYHGYAKVGYEGKPYFVGKNKSYSESSAKRRMNDFLGTLLNVYVFLLILIVLISMVVANSITRPLTILSDKLKLIQIGGTNQRLEWNHQDELGGLIRNYNEMIQELDRSTRMLAVTERETAWREMAKQVAHEIKNPLTPMKLITQHLQNSISRATPDEINQLVKRVTQTLIEQIENLSKIASEFSNFAKLPAPENEKLVLNEVVTSTHDLFRKREDMDIHLRVPIDEIYIFADKNHVIRVLTNLIKNAIQSIPIGRRGKIEIVLFNKEDKAIVRVMDNGCGIPESMKDKVFYPNFTTKNSGTGLGLAIVRDIVDSCNGHIYFTTIENKGTEFFVEFPLMHMEDNFKIVQRVSL